MAMASAATLNAVRCQGLRSAMPKVHWLQALTATTSVAA